MRRVEQLRVFALLRGGNVSGKVQHIQQNEQVRHRGISLRRTGVSHVLSIITLFVFVQGKCDAGTRAWTSHYRHGRRTVLFEDDERQACHL